MQNISAIRETALTSPALPKVAGCVVLFREPLRIPILQALASQLDLLILVDNSPEPLPPAELASLPGHYLHNANRNGLAGALNLAADFAISQDAQLLCTLDQDSELFSPQSLPQLIAAFLRGPQQLALLAPTPYYHYSTASHEDFTLPPQPALRPLTSGSLVRLSAWQHIHGMKPEFFIDSLDNEFCLRLQRQGYLVQQHPGILLHHSLGNTQVHYTFWNKRERHVSHHSPLRHYYISRNRLWTILEYRKDFPAYSREEFHNYLSTIAKVIVHEQQKCLKLYRILQGAVDCLRGHWGAKGT